MDEATKQPPSVGALLGALATETGTLVRQEVHLASTEMGEKAKSAALDLGLLLLGGALAHAGLLAVVFGVVVVLGAFIPAWASALVLGATSMLFGYSLVQRGMKALRELDPTPARTLATLSRAKPILKEQFR